MAYKVKLSEKQRKELIEVVRDGKLQAKVIMNAKIMLQTGRNIHTGAALYEMLEPAHARKILEKIEFHYTPKHGI